jgi:hypothetical protein
MDAYSNSLLICSFAPLARLRRRVGSAANIYADESPLNRFWVLPIGDFRPPIRGLALNNVNEMNPHGIRYGRAGSPVHDPPMWYFGPFLWFLSGAPLHDDEQNEMNKMNLRNL